MKKRKRRYFITPDIETWTDEENQDDDIQNIILNAYEQILLISNLIFSDNIIVPIHTLDITLRCWNSF